MSLTLWLKKIGDKEMPAFRKTAAEVSSAANNPETGTEALGKLILQDPALTARVLKLCNSAYYNPTAKAITTISRAVMVLGVDTVRSLCISLALIEALLNGKRQDRVLADLGRSLHAAMQARAMALALREPLAEEVFIAALLLRLGHMVFWCFSDDEGVALDGMLKSHQDDPLAEKAILGFSLTQLSQVLVEDWKLSPILLELFRGRRHGVPAECIARGWEIAKLVEKGWKEPAILELVTKMSVRLKSDPATAGGNLVRVAREAHQSALQFGSTACAAVIPIPEGPSDQDASLFAIYALGELEESEASPNASAAAQNADSMVVLGCLQELNKLATAGHLSPMFQAILKGFHEGLGFDRVVFATLVPGSDVVQGRSMLGASNVPVEGFKFTIRRQMADSLSRAMEQGTVVENIRDPMKRPAVVPDTLHSFIKGASFLFAPVQLNGRVVGAYYCDCQNSGRNFSPAMIEGFGHLIQQLNLLLVQASAVKAAVAA